MIELILCPFQSSSGDENVINKDTKSSATEAAIQPEERRSAKNNTGRKRTKVFPIILAVIGILVVILIVLSVINRQLKKQGLGGITPPDTTELVAGTYKIGAGEYMYWQFSCPDDGYKLVGSVSVPQYDINVWLIKGKREFEAFERRETFYHLSKVSAEKTSFHRINCLLEKGTYYFVVDNTYSILTSKNPTIFLSLVF